MKETEPTTNKLSKKEGATHRHGRGRRARCPWHMPPVAWKDTLWRTVLSIQGDRVSFIAAGMAFYLMLSLVPTLAAILTIYGMIFDVAAINEQISSLRGVIPSGVIDFAESELTRLSSQQNLGGTGVAISLLFALWGASKAHQGIATGLDVAYGQKNSRNFIAAKLRALAFALLTTAGSVIILGLLVLGPHVAQALVADFAPFLSVIRWPFLAIVFWLWVMVTFRYGPSRRPPRWRWVTVGSILATILWIVSSGLLSWAAGAVLDLGKTYGSLAGIALLLLWLYSFGFSLLVGAELDSEIEHQTVVDTTIGPDRPRGERGAYVADTVGRSKGENDSWLNDD
ncbi:MAG: YihY/virulence factor BrkB family protein [Verrucomicrobiota bacterium JB023]|nr:YihY/virulence factor BrkB family protein [Verrucomicrobiota bacterium JB023]